MSASPASPVRAGLKPAPTLSAADVAELAAMPSMSAPLPASLVQSPVGAGLKPAPTLSADDVAELDADMPDLEEMILDLAAEIRFLEDEISTRITRQLDHIEQQNTQMLSLMRLLIADGSSK